MARAIDHAAIAGTQTSPPRRGWTRAVPTGIVMVAALTAPDLSVEAGVFTALDTVREPAGAPLDPAFTSGRTFEPAAGPVLARFTLAPAAQTGTRPVVGGTVPPAPPPGAPLSGSVSAHALARAHIDVASGTAYLAAAPGVLPASGTESIAGDVPTAAPLPSLPEAAEGSALAAMIERPRVRDAGKGGAIELSAIAAPVASSPTPLDAGVPQSVSNAQKLVPSASAAMVPASSSLADLSAAEPATDAGTRAEPVASPPPAPSEPLLASQGAALAKPAMRRLRSVAPASTPPAASSREQRAPASAAPSVPAAISSALAPVPEARSVPAPGSSRPAAVSLPDIRGQLLARVDGKAVGKLDMQQSLTGLSVRLGSLVDVLADRYDAAELARIRSAGASNVYLPLSALQAQGIPITYDPVYDEFNVGERDPWPKAGRKVHIDQISTPERGGVGIAQVRP